MSLSTLNAATPSNGLSTAVSASRGSYAFTGHEPLLEVPIAVMQRMTMSPDMLSRGTFVTGATGSGKTLSVLLPLTLGLLGYRLSGCPYTAGLVIDPKNELALYLLSDPHIGPRTYVLGVEGAKPLQVFDTTYASLDDRLDALKALTPKVSYGDQSHWYEMGWSVLVEQFLQLQGQVLAYSAGRLNLFKWLLFAESQRHGPGFAPSLRQFAAYCHAPSEAQAEEDKARDAKRAHCREALDHADDANAAEEREIFTPAQRDLLRALPDNNLVLLHRLQQRLGGGGYEASKWLSQRIDAVITYIGAKHTACNPIKPFVTDGDLHKQIVFFLQSITPSMTALTDPRVDAVVALDPFADLYPPMSTVEATGSSKTQLFALPEHLNSGGVLVYQSGNLDGLSDQLCANVLRMRFTEHIQTRPNKLQPLAYICDEFHRYVRSDPVNGDDVFVSFCRSYRVQTVLASQSVMAIENALSANGAPSPRLATEALIANLGNRIWMNARDHRTQEDALTTMPCMAPQGWQHVLKVRPLNLMLPGEYYYLAADGRYGRTRATLPVEWQTTHEKEAANDSVITLAQNANMHL